MTNRLYFGTDGIRGVANQHPMTAEWTVRLGMAITEFFRSQSGTKRPTIVIGKDTRLSGYLFESSLAAGIVSMGGDVWLTGPLPTPAIAFITRSMRCDAGVVISASHNPFEDNGIKLFGSDGFKLPDTAEEQLEKLLESSLPSHLPSAKDIGVSRRIDDASGRYIESCKRVLPHDMTLEGLRIVVDTANGAAYKTAPAVFSELGAEVISIADHPNGKNINDKCGALFPGRMQAAVRQENADLGIALDGDADRLIACDDNGELLDGDSVLAICGTRLLQKNELPKRTVVATVMSNLGLEHALAKAGGRLLRTQVGDRHVVAAMRSQGHVFGGEQSGHLVFLDSATTGDGIVAALKLLSVAVAEQKPLSMLSKVLTQVPQVLVNLAVRSKPDIGGLPDVKRCIANIEEKLGTDGRVLVRYSGTEPKVRVMIEGPDHKVIAAYAKEIGEVLTKFCGVP